MRLAPPSAPDDCGYTNAGDADDVRLIRLSRCWTSRVLNEDDDEGVVVIIELSPAHWKRAHTFEN